MVALFLPQARRPIALSRPFFFSALHWIVSADFLQAEHYFGSCDANVVPTARTHSRPDLAACFDYRRRGRAVTTSRRQNRGGDGSWRRERRRRRPAQDDPRSLQKIGQYDTKPYQKHQQLVVVGRAQEGAMRCNPRRHANGCGRDTEGACPITTGQPMIVQKP